MTVHSFWFAYPTLTPVILAIKCMTGKSSGWAIMISQVLFPIFVQSTSPFKNTMQIGYMIWVLIMVCEMILFFNQQKGEILILRFLGMSARQSRVILVSETVFFLLISIIALGIVSNIRN